jgi:predicted ribosome quality control (RQC) complex YloA/Tae2 family protein
VAKASSRLERKKQLHKKLIEDAKGAHLYKLYGELIISNMYALKEKRIADPLELVNYYEETNETVKIPIDVSLSYHKNAEAYFKKAMKLEKGSVYSKKAVKEINQELDYLNTLSYHIQTAVSNTDVEQIRKELEDQGYIKRASGRKQPKKADKPLSFYHYISSEGFDIFIGRNNIQNEYLTLKAASSKDMWLHVKDYPGSHVIIRRESKEFTDKVIFEAAMLAAYHSKASSSLNTDVDYTLVKNVKRHSNKKPGMVYYTDHKTVNVSPDEKKIKSMIRKV